MWRTGNHVICRKEQEVFEAEIVGFYEKSAVVVNLFNDERTVCSFRNILDPATYKPLKHTDKKHAISTGGNWETSYIPTRKEKEKWTGDILKGEPHFIRNDDLLRTYRKNKKS